MAGIDVVRHAPRRTGIAVLVLAVVGATVWSSAVHATTAARSGAGASQPRAIGWPLPGQNLDNARAATDSRITAANVKDLTTAFTTDLPRVNALSTAPLVADHTLFLQGATGSVAAIDTESGTTRWTSPATGFNIGPFGVAAADGRLFADAGSDGVLALDQNTGQQLWRTKLTTTPTLGVDIPPTVFDGLVFASTVPVSIGGIFKAGDRGTLYALDADTGAVRWSFDTVKSDDLWSHPEINSGGGAWYAPAVDTKRRLVIFGTGNPAPFPGTAEYPNGTSRPGANLYTDSVVALDVDTATLRWYHQVTPHDLYHRDQVHVMLTHLANGREVVISAGKSGEVLGLDPDTGRVLWQRSVGIHRNDTDRTLHGATDVWPGTYGGVETPPATAEGVVYVATLNAPSKLSPDQTAYFGGQLGTQPGEIVAINAVNGKIIWDTTVPNDPLGGTTVVNDLVLTATLDGVVIALRRDTGKIVWTHKAAGGINGWLTASGDTLYVPVGNTKAPNLLALRLLEASKS